MKRNTDCPCFSPDKSGEKCVGGTTKCWACELWTQDPRAYCADDDTLMKRLARAVETLDWSLEIEDIHERQAASFRKKSPLGADVTFSVVFKNAPEMVSEIEKYADSFDIDECVVQQLGLARHKYKKPPRIRALLGDAEEIKFKLKYLACVCRKMVDESWYVVLDRVSAERLIVNEEPRGRFLYQDKDTYTGIDNTAGKCLVKDFLNEADCLFWLAELMEARL